MGSPDRPSKQEAFLALLGEGWTSLHLDARRGGVVVPPHLKNEPHLVLQYGHNLQIPIPDLHVDESGVTATLSFARRPCATAIPWSAVYIVESEDGRGVLYHEDIPEDVSVVPAGAAGGAVPRGGAATKAAGAKDAGADGSVGVGAEGDLVSDGLPSVGDPGSTAPPARALRAVPLGGPLEGTGAGAGTADGAALGLVDGADGPALLPARRRRRPQLRLVK